MGNSNGCTVSEYDVQQKLTNIYEITQGKEGFAVLVGSEPHGSGNGAGLPSMDSALKRTCHVDTQAPFLSQSKINRAMPMFTEENFEKLCRLLFDKDMLQSLGLYSSLFFYFCGYGDGTGMITVDNHCIPYINMVKRVLEHSLGTHKPTVFIFDCHLRENTSIQIKSIARDFTEQLSPSVSDTLVCISFSDFKLSSASDTFTSELASAIEKYSHLLSLTDLIDLAGSRVQYKADGKFLGPLCLDYLNAQFMFVQDPTVKTCQEPELWIDYCCTQIMNTFGNGHSKSTSSDPAVKLGLGHGVCILYAYDSCGTQAPPNSVYTLAKSLFGLGFEVFCECIGVTSPQRDWIRWYCLLLSHCDNVIIVPSPTLAQTFSTVPSVAPCVKVFTQLHQGISNKRVLQYHLVMLADEYDHKCVPAVFASQKLYRLTDSDLTDTSSLSHTSSSSNEYRSLVFCMARQPPPSSHSLPQTLSHKSNNSKTITTDDQVPNLTTLEEIKAYFFRPVKQGYKVVTQVTQPIHRPMPMHRPIPKPPSPPPVVSSDPPPPNTGTHLPRDQRALNLSKEHVSIQAMLWLSGKAVHWKFLGRKLSVDDFQLQRIEIENPRDISEQIYQMLDKWMANSTFEDANYDTLVRAVEFAEGKAVKEEFLEFVINNCLGTNHDN